MVMRNTEQLFRDISRPKLLFKHCQVGSTESPTTLHVYPEKRGNPVKRKKFGAGGGWSHNDICFMQSVSNSDSLYFILGLLNDAFSTTWSNEFRKINLMLGS